MVCDGESVTLPDACELFTTVRDALPAFAMIVIEDALVACHVSVTLCPAPIDVLLAEKVRLGAPAFDMACDPQPVSVVKMIIAKKEKPVRRSALDFIRTLVPGPLQREIQSCRPELLPPDFQLSFAEGE